MKAENKPKTYFVTRHSDATKWAAKNNIAVDVQLSHFDPSIIKKGDVVIGTLPVQLVYEVNKLGGKYLHLSIDIPREMRGKELSASEMQACNARLEPYRVIKE